MELLERYTTPPSSQQSHHRDRRSPPEGRVLNYCYSQHLCSVGDNSGSVSTADYFNYVFSLFTGHHISHQSSSVHGKLLWEDVCAQKTIHVREEQFLCSGQQMSNRSSITECKKLAEGESYGGPIIYLGESVLVLSSLPHVRILHLHRTALSGVTVLHPQHPPE